MLLLGESASRTTTENIPSFLSSSFNEEDFAELTANGPDAVSLGDLAFITLKVICSQEWVRDICLQVPDDLCKQGYLLDNHLPPNQTLSLLRLICHTNKDDSSAGARRSKQHETDYVIKNMIIKDLDEWSLRASIIDIKLMYKLENRKERKEDEVAVGSWLEDVARCIVEAFKLGENNDDLLQVIFDNKVNNNSISLYFLCIHCILLYFPLNYRMLCTIEEKYKG